MSFVSLYRKWRSQNFDEIVGQIHVTRTIKNAIEHERISHAYLFCGPRGTGKTSTARILAKSLNCEKGPLPNPCNRCETCTQISLGAALDVIEIDAASNRGINEIRELREKVKYAPTKGRYKVYIVDEVHMLTKEAFNALLKTLEEPPKHVIFVLATTEPHKLLPTILSRCQRFDFKRISINDTVKHLKEISKKENLKVEEGVLNLIAGSSEGSLRDALSMLDQLISFSGRDIKLPDAEVVLGTVSEKVFLDLADCILRQEPGKILDLTRKLIEEGKDINQLIKEFIRYFRDLLVIKICSNYKELVDRIPASLKEMDRQAKNITIPRIMNIIKILTDLKHQLTWDSQWHIQMEISFLRMCHRSLDKSPDILEERLTELEQKIKNLPQIIMEKKDIITEIIPSYPVKEPAHPISAKEPEQPIETVSKEIKEDMLPAPAEERDNKKQVEIQTEEISLHESISPEEVIQEQTADSIPDEEVFIKALEEEDYPSSMEITAVPEKKKEEKPELITIKNRWEDFLHRFKGENLPIYQILISGEVTELSGNLLILSFTNSFYREQIEDSNYKNKIENALERFYGKKISIKAKLIERQIQEMSLFGDNSEANSSRKEKTFKDNENNGPSIDEATKLFEGEIINSDQ